MGIRNKRLAKTLQRALSVVRGGANVPRLLQR